MRANEPPREAERYELHEPLPYSFVSTRRDFLELLGAGLLVFVATADAQQRGTTLEARLHLAEDGTVTVLNGKVEEGQGPRTELAMVAAEELRLPLTRIRVDMADTGTTPDDGITAGSRTTPSTVPAVRRAAAALRQLRESAGVADYGALARSPEFARAYKAALPPDVKLTPASEWKLLGTPQTRLNAREIVTGAHRFPSDIERPGMLYGAVLRAPSYGATLAEVDLNAAAAASGGMKSVRKDGFVGCAAATSYAARQGIAALAATAKWKPGAQPQPASPQVFEHFRKTAERAVSVPAPQRFDLKAEYRTAYIQHAPMEPRAAVAEWQDDKLTVWTGTSNPFAVRQQLAQSFAVPPERVRVIVPDFGGGFGGKHTGEAALEAAMLAREAGRPVKVRWTRAEEFAWAYSRPAALIEVTAALDGSRRGLAEWHFVNYNSGTSALDTPYRTGRKHTQFLPADSPLRQGSYRALASTANNFARESAMDELAALAGLDPLEFRLANLENERLRAVLTAAAERFRWSERRKGKRAAGATGIGLACGTEKGSYVAACAEVAVDPKTGAPRLLEIVQAYECGAILNPLGLRQQVEGCILMGLGAVLREEMQFENGRVTNGRFSAYRATRFADSPPKMELVLLDRKDLDPIGAGETPIIAVAPAMANAVFDATGQRRRSLPLRGNRPKVHANK